MAPAAGDLLLNAAGQVMGILYDPDPNGAPPVTYLPTQLVVGVADALRSGSHVVPGVLGVAGGDAPGGSGALVETVKAGSPAAGKLRPGEVVGAVNTLPVRTMAELRGRIYVLAPGTTVALSVHDGAEIRIVNVTLSGSS